jgi:hypothetical protein
MMMVDSFMWNAFFFKWRKIMIVCTMSNEIYFGTTQKLRCETMAMLPSIHFSMLSLEESNEIWLLSSTMSTFFDNLKSIDYEWRSWPYSKHKVWIMVFANKYGAMLMCLVPRSWSNMQLGFILFFWINKFYENYNRRHKRKHVKSIKVF